VKDYRQIVTIDGDELEAVWCYEPQTMDEPEHWTLVSVDGWEEHNCPDEIWAAADLAMDPTQMEEIDHRDFESIIEDIKELETWSVK